MRVKIARARHSAVVREASLSVQRRESGGRAPAGSVSRVNVSEAFRRFGPRRRRRPGAHPTGPSRHPGSVTGCSGRSGRCGGGRWCRPSAHGALWDSIERCERGWVGGVARAGEVDRRDERIARRSRRSLISTTDSHQPDELSSARRTRRWKANRTATEPDDAGSRVGAAGRLTDAVARSAWVIA